tara:strand:+ start:2225 stop:3013 length:789 start_codon:yes stop_codon:yes gene_type:complete
MRFFIGCHKAVWLERTKHPLFISHRTLMTTKKERNAISTWALDSGGFTELNLHGTWTIDADSYIESVRRYQSWGGLQWAAPQDWMVEPWIIEKTGLSVEEHQRRTVDNFLYLRSTAPDLPFIPVLQGWSLEDYENCFDMYAKAGVDLVKEDLVGLGSVCRRQSKDEIADIVERFYRKGLKLHGFGVKIRGLDKYGRFLHSADSFAWSVEARYLAHKTGKKCSLCEKREDPPLACNNCMTYAIEWAQRHKLLKSEKESRVKWI